MSELEGSTQSYQKYNIEIWSKHEPVNRGEGHCKKSAALCTGPSTWLTVGIESMKVHINLIANRLRGISQATVISVPTNARPTFRTGAIGGEVGRLGLRKSISVLPMMNDRGLGLMQTSGHTWNLLWVLNHSLPSDFNLITYKFNSMSDQCPLWGGKIERYLTTNWHGYVCRTDGRRRSYQGRRGIDATAIHGFRLIFIW